MSSAYSGTVKEGPDQKSQLIEKITSGEMSPYLSVLSCEDPDGKPESYYGREDEKQQCWITLGSGYHTNVCLVGESGVGKTAIVKSLALDIQKGNCPSKFANTTVLSLDVSHFHGGPSTLDRIGKLLSFLEDVENSSVHQIILYINDVHLLCDQESKNYVANVLKLILKKDGIMIVADTTLNNYKEFIEIRREFGHLFSRVNVDEPNDEETVRMLKSHRLRFEKRYNVKILDSAIEISVQMATDFFPHCSRPSSAFLLLQKACDHLYNLRDKIEDISTDIKQYEEDGEREMLEIAKVTKRGLEEELERKSKCHQKHKEDLNNVLRVNNVRELEAAYASQDSTTQAKSENELIPTSMQQEEEHKVLSVTPNLIALIVSDRAKISTGDLTRNEVELLRNLPLLLSEKIKGQASALKEICSIFCLVRSALNDATKPSSFLFLGPSGCGKALTAETLAKIFYPGRDALIRIDCTLFSQEESLSSLACSPPGYPGFSPFNALRENPNQMILFENIEAMHPKVRNLLFRPLDEGYMPHSTGQKLDFSKAIMIFTSQIGADKISNGRMMAKMDQEMMSTDTHIEYQGFKSNEEINDLVMQDVRKVFPVEFSSRIRFKVIFKPHCKTSAFEMIDLELASIKETMKEKLDFKISVSREVKEYLFQKSFGDGLGSRDLKRLIEKEILVRILFKMTNGQGQKGDTFNVNYVNGNLTFTTRRSLGL